MNKISESGVIGMDGKLRLPMDRVNAFCKANRGTRVVVVFEAAEHGSTAAQQSYYYRYVIPTLVQAYHEQGTRITGDNVDKQLLQLYPGEKGEENIGLCVDVDRARSLSKSQMSDFLEWLKQYAAENLSVYIEDPKTL